MGRERGIAPHLVLPGPVMFQLLEVLEVLLVPVLLLLLQGNNPACQHTCHSACRLSLSLLAVTLPVGCHSPYSPKLSWAHTWSFMMLVSKCLSSF